MDDVIMKSDKAVPTQTSNDQQQSLRTLKSKGVCFAWVKGNCKRGVGCKFIHDLTPNGGDDDSSHQQGKRKRVDGDDSVRKKEYVRQQYGKDVDPSQCTNKMFEEYYVAQGIVPVASEWPDFLATLRTSLPLCLRISRFRESWPNVVAEVKRSKVCTEVGWYPDSLSWRCSNDDYHAEVNKSFKIWAKKENWGGSLTFQEEVSLLPPLLLDIQPDSVLLDMCAAPGSKTLEALEIMHSKDSWEVSADPIIATGICVANDLDARRVNNILLNRIRKLHTPCVLVTIGNAAKFPCFLNEVNGEDTGGYDRIMLDAPCSGDGTMRKEPNIWKSWLLRHGVEMHPVQYKLLCRAISLVRVGGRVVYSTCSMNPLENEAVVAAVLRKFPGKVRLEDGSSLVPDGLCTSPGLTTWKVPNPKLPNVLTWVTSIEGLPENLQASSAGNCSVRETMFAPTDVTEAAKLTKCIRLLPHHNDAGAFFCAVLTKTGPLFDSSDVVNMEDVNKLDVSESQTTTESNQDTNINPTTTTNNNNNNATTTTTNNSNNSNTTNNITANADAATDIDTSANTNADATTTNTTNTTKLETETETDAATAITQPLASNPDKATQDTSDNANSKGKGKGKGRGKGKAKNDGKVKGSLFYNDQHYQELVTDSVEYQSLDQFYGVSKAINLFSFTDKGGNDRKIAAVSKGVRDWLVTFSSTKIKFKQTQLTSFGVRAFKKYSGNYLPDSSCRWRPCQEGTALMSRIVRRRRVRVPLVDLLEQQTTQL